MWDLRQCRSVRRFTGHANRKTGTGVAFSPCMNYVASGSEDKVGGCVGLVSTVAAAVLLPVCVFGLRQMAYVYDIGTSKICERLGGATDAVTDVAWNPRVRCRGWLPAQRLRCVDTDTRMVFGAMPRCSAVSSAGHRESGRQRALLPRPGGGMNCEFKATRY